MIMTAWTGLVANVITLTGVLRQLMQTLPDSTAEYAPGPC